MIDGRADLVVCDGAPDVTGLHDIDEYIQVAFLMHSTDLQNTIFLPGATATCRPEHQHPRASLWRHVCCQDFQRERCQLALQVNFYADAVDAGDHSRITLFTKKWPNGFSATWESSTC